MLWVFTKLYWLFSSETLICLRKLIYTKVFTNLTYSVEDSKTVVCTSNIYAIGAQRAWRHAHINLEEVFWEPQPLFLSLSRDSWPPWHRRTGWPQPPWQFVVVVERWRGPSVSYWGGIYRGLQSMMWAASQAYRKFSTSQVAELLNVPPINKICHYLVG